MKNDKIQTAFTDAGEGGAVVLLHGHPFNRSMWRRQVKAFQMNFRIITPDLRGYGESPIYDDVSTMSDMANDVVKLLDSLGLEKVVLGGLSMGGYVVLEFFNQFPERVRALVLADTKAQADTEEARKKRYESAEKVLKEGLSPIAGDMLPKALAPNTHEKQLETVKFVREMMLATKPEGAAAALRGMGERTDHTALLEKIKVPTLIIVGEEDSITPPADAEKMHRAIENSQLVSIANAGHLTPVEQPEKFNDALRKFLQSL